MAMTFPPNPNAVTTQQRALFHSESRNLLFECASASLVEAFKGRPDLKDVTGDKYYETTYAKQRLFRNPNLR